MTSVDNLNQENNQIQNQIQHGAAESKQSESNLSSPSSSVILRIKRKRDQDPVEALLIDQSQRALKRRTSTRSIAGDGQDGKVDKEREREDGENGSDVKSKQKGKGSADQEGSARGE